MMNLNKILIKGILILILAVVPIGFFVISMDPYQFFKSDDLFIEQERFQIPGLARNQMFDTAIIGTSMIENFVDSEVSENLGVDAIKLPLNASFVTEQGMVVDMATAHNDMKHIIWNIDYRCIDIYYGELYEKEIKFPKYMYDELRYNDWRYIVNHSNLFLSIKKLFYEKNEKDHFNEFKTDLNNLNSWYYWQEFSEQLLIEDYTKLKSGERKLSDKLNTEIDLNEIKKVIDIEIVDRIKEYSDINFSLIFPPKSILWFRLLDEKGLLKDKERAQLYLLEQLENLDNVEVYNFQNIYEITEDFDIYHDLNHYNKSGNDYMIRSIKEKNHITSPTQYKKQMEDLKSHMYSEKIDHWLKKQE